MRRYIFIVGTLFLLTPLFTPAESIFYQQPYYNNSYSYYPKYAYNRQNSPHYLPHYSQNYLPRYRYQQNAYPGKNSVWQKISNYFSGQMTGFTPPIQYPSQIYTPDTTSVTEHSAPFLGTQYRTNNLGRSSGSKITILD